MNVPSGHYPFYVFSNILIGLILSLVLGQVAIWFARRVGLMDLPGALPHKQHKFPTPLAGGLTIVMTLLVSGLVFNLPMVKQLWTVLLPALIIFGVGLWDDFKRLPAWIKFIGQVIASILLIALGTYVQIIPAKFLGLPGDANVIVNWLITFIWVIGMTNAFNFVDSMDGLLIGLSGIAVAFLVLVTLDSTQTSLLQLLTLLLGVCAGLFFYNLTPARLFIGDSGAQTIGFLLATVAILYTPQNYPQASSWFLPIVILGVPIFDMTLVVFSRLRRRLPVYHAARDHTYHRLAALGLDTSHAVAIIHLAAIALGCVAFIALNLEPLYANLLFAVVCLTGIAALFFLDREKHE
jgi:UDP-GlcNAc:undecaprenyl-phosphate/decaprenyl-phosphate GlcNAc-1-phosphate transferase